MENHVFGVMVDCSRNAVLKLDAVKSFIDKLAVMGYNALMLYTEDTYTIEGEPLFGHLRGRYSQEELKEADAYAAAHGIELIPCIQTLAHVGKMFMWPQYGSISDTDDILLVDEEKTYDFIEKIIKTCAECFTSRKIHIGMDEAILLGLGKYLQKHSYCDRFSILTRHLRRVCDITRKYRFKPIMWSDMFFRLLYNNDYYGLGKEIPDEVRKALPPDIGLVYWDYYHDETERYEAHIDEHLKLTQDVWFAGGIWKWLGFHSSNQKSISRTEKALTACRNKGVQNIILTLWADDGGECSINAVLPTLFYASELYKGHDLKDAKKNFEKTFGESWDDMMLCDMLLPYCDYEQGEWFNNGTKAMLFSDAFLGIYDSSVRGDGLESKCFSEYEKKFAGAASRSLQFGTMYKSYEKLCKVLSVKYDLGYETRVAYQAKDIKRLKALTKVYEKAISNFQEFAEAFYKLWVTDNKPHGFDVQDIRIGGAIQRLKSCLARLRQYIGGETDRIEELEEPLLDFYGNEELTRRPIFCQYKQAATANKL